MADLGYAHDFVLMSKTLQGLQRLTLVAEDNLQAIGMVISMSKARYWILTCQALSLYNGSAMADLCRVSPVITTLATLPI